MGALPSFIYGEDQPIKTPEDLARQRALVDAMMSQQAGAAAPRNLGEGLTAIGKALMVRQARNSLQNNVSDIQAGQDAFAPIVAAALAGQGSPSAPSAGNGAIPQPSITAGPYDGSGPGAAPVKPSPQPGAVPIGQIDAKTGAAVPTNPNMPPALGGPQPAAQPTATPAPAIPAMPQPNAMTGQLQALVTVANDPRFQFASPAKQQMVLEQIKTIQGQLTPLAQTQLAAAQQGLSKGAIDLQQAQDEQAAIKQWVGTLPPDQQLAARANPAAATKAYYDMLAMKQRYQLGSSALDAAVGGSQGAQPASPAIPGGLGVVPTAPADNPPVQQAGNVPGNVTLSPQLVAAAKAADFQNPGAGAQIVANAIQHQQDQNQAGALETAKAVGAQAVKDATDMHDKAQGAVSDIAIINQGRDLLNSGMYTGKWADAQVAFNAALEKAGITSDNPKVSNTQAYAGLMGNRVGNIIKQFGSGTGLSDADRQYAQAIAGGNIAVDEKAIRRLLDIGEKIDRVTIQRYNKQYYPMFKNQGAGDMYQIQEPGPYVPQAAGADQTPVKEFNWTPDKGLH